MSLLTAVKMSDVSLSPAEKMYKNHLRQVSLYQKRYPEKMRLKCKKYNENLKKMNPEKYEALLQQKRDYYYNVTKPKQKLGQD